MNDPNSSPKRSRLEDEVLEILERTDRKPPLTARARAWGRTARIQTVKWRSHVGWLDTAWGWFGIALLLFIVGGWIAKDSGLLQQVIQIAGIVAIGVAILDKATNPDE